MTALQTATLSLLLAAGQADEPAAPDAPAATIPSAATIPPEATSLRVDFVPGVWIPRLDGETVFGGATLDLSSQFLLDAQEATFNGEVTIRKGELYELMLSGAAFSTSSAGTFAGTGTFGTLALSDGDAFESSFDLTTVGVELGFNVYRPLTRDLERAAQLDNVTIEGEHIADLRIAPIVGVRYVDVDHRVASGGSSATGDGEWLALYGGVQLTLDYRPEQNVPMLERVRMQGAIGLGPALGGEGGLVWQVRGGFTINVTDAFGIVIGYRLLELDVENDGYELSGGLQGLFFAGSLTF